MSDPLIGHKIGNYVISDKLGEGGMGTVYLALHPKIERKVAVKVLAPHLSVHPRISERFHSEAKALSRIEHPNIIEVYDYGALEDGRLFYVMEFLRGQELGQVMVDRGRLEAAEMLPYLEQICAGLQAAHDNGVVHRDLKPENIFVLDRQPMSIKLLDFGIAKLLDPDQAEGSITHTGVVMGTPLYISPEQAAGDVHRIGPRTDIYSLGVILYWMLGGRPPFVERTPALLMAQHITLPPPPLAQVEPLVPPAVAAAVEQCLEKDPARRPGSAMELFTAFATACGYDLKTLSGIHEVSSLLHVLASRPTGSLAATTPASEGEVATLAPTGPPMPVHMLAAAAAGVRTGGGQTPMGDAATVAQLEDPTGPQQLLRNVTPTEADTMAVLAGPTTLPIPARPFVPYQPSMPTPTEAQTMALLRTGPGTPSPSITPTTADTMATGPGLPPGAAAQGATLAVTDSMLQPDSAALMNSAAAVTTMREGAGELGATGVTMRPRSSRGRVLALAVVGLAAVGVAGVLALSRPWEQPPQAPAAGSAASQGAILQQGRPAAPPTRTAPAPTKAAASAPAPAASASTNKPRRVSRTKKSTRRARAARSSAPAPRFKARPDSGPKASASAGKAAASASAPAFKVPAPERQPTKKKKKKPKRIGEGTMPFEFSNRPKP